MEKFHPVKTALIGSGMISGIYLKNLKDRYNIIDLVGCSDIVSERSCARAEEFGIKQMTNEDIFSDESIEFIVNTTYPLSHYEVAKQALLSGKHVYTEKMMTTSVSESDELINIARENNLYVGGAPDTFLAGGIQTARKILDSGMLGVPVMANAILARSYHHERFYDKEEKRFAFCKNGGIIFDMGSYYLACLVFLLGPINRVTGFSQIRDPNRVYQNPKASIYGKDMLIESFNNTTGCLEFENGVLGNITMTSESSGFDNKFIIYCTDGYIDLGDPNEYNRDIKIKVKGSEPTAVPTSFSYYGDNFRGLGAADMAYAIRYGRKARCGGEQNRHILEAALGICESSEKGTVYNMTTTCERAEPLAVGYPENPELSLFK